MQISPYAVKNFLRVPVRQFRHLFCHIEQWKDYSYQCFCAEFETASWCPSASPGEHTAARGAASAWLAACTWTKPCEWLKTSHPCPTHPGVPFVTSSLQHCCCLSTPASWYGKPDNLCTSLVLKNLLSHFNDLQTHIWKHPWKFILYI